jgi:hypothetical protein
MFTRITFVLAALVAATALATACEPPFPPLPPDEFPPPKKPAPAVTPFPQVGTVTALDGKEETIEYTVVVPVLVRETIYAKVGNLRVTDDGGKTWEPVRRPVSVYRWHHKQVTRKSKIDRLKFSDASGKPIPTLDAWKRLEIGTTFFVSADGQPVSAAHRKLMAPDALVAVDFDNVVMERILQELELSDIEQWFPKPRPLPKPLPELR